MRQHWMCPSCGNTLTISDIPFEFARITGAECSRCHVEMIGEPLEVVLHRD